MKIREEIAEMGFHPSRGEYFIAVDGPSTKYTMDQVGDLEIEDLENVYLATGTFDFSRMKPREGRVAANVEQILTMMFDADLKDFIIETPDAIEEILRSSSDEEVMGMATILMENAQHFANEVGIRFHRIDYTGSGIACHIYLKDAYVDSRQQLADAQKILIARMNELAGFPLFDPNVSDPGTRIARIPGSLNTKRARRRVKTIWSSWKLDAWIYPGQLIELTKAKKRSSSPVPLRSSFRMEDEDVEVVVDTVKRNWNPGRRHQLALGLAGYLAKAGVSEDQCAAIIQRVADGDEETRDRLATVRTTYERIRAGVDVGGYTILKSALNESAVQFIDQQVNRFRGPTPILVRQKQREDEDFSADPMKHYSSLFPRDCLTGWFEDYVSLMSPTTEADDTYHLASSLTVAGAMVGRRIMTNAIDEPVYPNLYTLIIGRSGSSRKDSAIKKALSMVSTGMGSMETPFFDLRTSFPSYQSIIKALSDGRPVLWKASEVTSIYDLIGKRLGEGKAAEDSLINLWDNPPFESNDTVSRQAFRADHPSLSILAATQPDRLVDTIKLSNIHSGFSNRWLYIPGYPKEKKPLPPKADPAEVISLYQRMSEAIRGYGGTSTHPSVIPFDLPAEYLWEEWYRHHDQGQEDPERDDIMQRFQNQVLKVALLYAISFSDSVIREDYLDRAIKFVSWSMSYVEDAVKTWGTSQMNVLEEKVLKVVKESSMKGESLSRKALATKCRSNKWNYGDITKAVRSLLENQILEIDANNGVILSDVADRIRTEGVRAS